MTIMRNAHCAMQDLKPSADNNRQKYLTQDNGTSDNNSNWDYIINFKLDTSKNVAKIMSVEKPY